MKNILFVMVMLGSILSAAFAKGYTSAEPQTIPVNYLDSTQVVNSFLFLNHYPEKGSPEWLVDVQKYIEGKMLNDTARVNQAILDAYLHGNGLANAFNIIFPFEISWENSPATYYIMVHAREDAGGLATHAAKVGYHRKRPFEEFEEHTRIPDVEPEYIGTGSYPSGHSAIGWLTALILAEIAPEYALEIMKRGYEIGESRVILGFHYQSDVEAGRLLASMVYPMLQNNPEFVADMEAAKAEYRRIMYGE